MGAIEPWVIAAAGGRWLVYGAVLLAVGSASFIGLVATSSTAARLGARAALAAVAFHVLAVGLGGAALMGGGFWSLEAWRFGLASSAGTSALIGAPAMLVLLTGLRRGHRVALVVGVVVGLASFLVTGHAATAAPPAVMVPVVAVHLACAAFWIGALAPLFSAADKAEATQVFRRFSARAVVAVALLVLSGVVISAVQLASFDALFATAYGKLLVVKLALVALLIALAAANRLILTPRLADGAEAMRRSLLTEFVLLTLVLAAAASLTAAPPPRVL